MAYLRFTKVSELMKNVNNQNRHSYIEISYVQDLKLRPIVAGPACQTHSLSDFIDIRLKPFTRHVKSVLRDTVDFLNSLLNTIPEETLLAFFLYVESLYSNIPHQLGIGAVAYWLNKYPDNLPGRFNKEFILEGIELILTNNSFYFDGSYYRQIKGTAMVRSSPQCMPL